MPAPATAARKRSVKLRLDESLVAAARNYTTDLSAMVEELLAAFLVEQEQSRAARRQLADACSGAWNAMHDKVGSFADEHSTL